VWPAGQNKQSSTRIVTSHKAVTLPHSRRECSLSLLVHHILAAIATRRRSKTE